MNELGTGLRYNKDKPRHELIPAWALNEIAKVYTKGAEKYEPNNWRKGMKWSYVIASLKRHLSYLEMGQDFDYDPNCKNCLEGNCTNHLGKDIYHAAQIAWNAITLLEYFKIYPQGDDRTHTYLNRPHIGLDIDDVLADWCGAWSTLHKTEMPTSWLFDRAINNKFKALQNDSKLDEFYLSLPIKTKPEDIPFEPKCYVTSRPVSKEITEEWLDKNGYPTAPVYQIKMGESKLDVIKSTGIDIFVDDRFDNFVELNKNGICCYLFDAPHNQRYDVGYKRIKSLKDLKFL